MLVLRLWSGLRVWARVRVRVRVRVRLGLELVLFAPFQKHFVEYELSE